MLGLRRVITLRAIVAVFLAAFATARSWSADDSPAPIVPPTPPRAEAPIYIILDAPADLDAFWKRLDRPDFILRRGDEADARAPVPTGPDEADRAVLDALDARGEVLDDLAHLSVEFGVALTGDEPVWVPIRLDGLTVTRARESTRTLPLRQVDGGWQVEVRGGGRHRVVVELLVPVKPSSEGRRIELAIPRVASTRVQLDVANRVVDAVAGGTERVSIREVEGGDRSRIEAHLSPRTRIELAWQVEAGSGLELPPLLEARGLIQAEVAPGSLRARSTWLVSSTRGVIRTLELRLEPDEELLELELDGLPLAAEFHARGGTTEVAIPLPEPLRPGPPRKLMLLTRRPVPAGSGEAESWTFRGVPFGRAGVQSGVLAIGQSGGLWVDGEPDRALRPIDPRDLPADLRARPATASALSYQFFEQPFTLRLRADPAPSHVRVEGRSTLRVDAGLARLDTWLDYQVARGQVDRVEVRLPRGLDLESAGPDDAIVSYHWLPEVPGARTSGSAGGSRVLTLQLASKARVDGSFRIHLVGRQAVDPDRIVPFGLFQPRGAGASGSSIAVLTARNVVVDLPMTDGARGEAAEFAPAGLAPPADWPWPSDVLPTETPPALFLRHDASPATLPLEVAVRPRTLHHETTLTARVERLRLDVQQETACHVHYGTLTHVDVTIPPRLEGLWSVDNDEVAGREHLRIEPDGQHRYRLALDREVTGTLRLRFRYRLPIEPALGPTRPARLEVPEIAVLEGSSGSSRLRLSADPGISLSPEGPGWLRVDDDGTGPIPESASAAAIELVRASREAGPAVVVARAHPLAELPGLVASRLWLRTIQGAEGELRTSALYRLEAHRSTFAVALPSGSEWIRARVGGAAVTEVEPLPEGGYRLRFPPATSTGPVLVGLEYSAPPPDASGLRWHPPRLLEGGVVQQIFWELAIPGARTLVGTPPGWSDENRWSWQIYWRRRPWKDDAALSAWVQGDSTRPGLADDPGEGGLGGYHSYLFSRQGDPTELGVATVSRAGMVGVCSGLVLAAGVLLLVRWPSGWLVVAPTAALAIAVGAALRPDETLLVVQSSLVGVGLTILAGIVHRLSDRAGPASRIGSSSGRPASSLAGSSSLMGLSMVGSDESTAIRARPGSTAEHVPPFYSLETPGSGSGQA